MAKPNARSSHKEPTPQGGGIAVVGATLAVSAGVLFFFGRVGGNPFPLLVIFGAVLLMAAIGVLADKRPIAPAPRLVLQTFAVAGVLATLPPELRVLPVLPWWSERILLLIGTLWFVNLVNFMDGLDWMTVVEAVPITAMLGTVGLLGYLAWQHLVISLSLCGAIIGFAFFNRPVAKLFLGDVGSLPIGLLLGWCLLHLAWHQHLIAALLLPLYYLADATLTLSRRIARREPFWAAHRSHFYQRATDNGFGVSQVVGEVFALNVVLAALAMASVTGSATVGAASLFTGAFAVALVLFHFSRRRSR
jgi:UDP-N-acetylmuramyl pentapeptide phosphotransferase/UDP-N-acetylglucosamine-1-phosphate transferase